MQTVLFVPAYDHWLPADDATVIAALEQKGYEVKFISLDWNEGIDKWKEKLTKEYKKYDPKETIIAGHSLGGTTAFVVAATAEKPPAQLWLFSLSARFAEDMPRLSAKDLACTTPFQNNVFKKIHFHELVPHISCKTLLFIGEEERKKFPIMAARTLEAHTAIAGSQYIVIPNAGPNLAHPRYLRAVLDTIK